MNANTLTARQLGFSHAQATQHASHSPSIASLLHIIALTASPNIGTHLKQVRPSLFLWTGVRKAESVFQRAKTHHHDHPTGEFHFDQWDVEAFRKFQVRISPADREWLQEMEEDMNCLIWKQARNPQAEPPTFADRMLVLQMRDAHHHARILELEEEKRESDHLVEAAVRVQARNIARIQGFLTTVSVDGSVACDICCEPFNSPEIGTEQREIAVKLPCGHLFGRTSIWSDMY